MGVEGDDPPLASLDGSFDGREASACVDGEEGFDLVTEVGDDGIVGGGEDDHIAGEVQADQGHIAGEDEGAFISGSLKGGVDAGKGSDAGVGVLDQAGGGEMGEPFEVVAAEHQVVGEGRDTVDDVFDEGVVADA